MLPIRRIIFFPLIVYLFLMAPYVGLQFVIVGFPGHTPRDCFAIVGRGPKAFQIGKISMENP